MQLIAAVAALFAVFAITASGASAAVPAHTHKEIFGAPTPPAFQNAGGMAVDPSTGNVYVIEFETKTLRRYKANGEGAPFSALGENVIDGQSGEDETPQEEILSSEGSSVEAAVAVAPPSAGATAGNIYVTDAANGQIDIFSSSGKYLGQKSFGYPCGVAVGPTGTVFVGSFENEAAVYKLEPSSTPGQLNEIAHFPTTSPCQVAAGYGPAAGSVFVAAFLGPISKLNATTGTTEFEFLTESRMLASDATTGHVYVAMTGAVQELDAAGGAAQEVSNTVVPTEGLGVGVNPITGNLYLVESGNTNVEVFNPLTKTLTITVVGNGEVKCKDLATSGGFGPCASTYPEAHTIKLQATAGSGSFFEGWSEVSGSGPVATPCSGAVTECEVRMDGDVTVKATFPANPTANLKVTRSGTGSGSVSSVPAGINCGSVCESSFQIGKPITLEATAASGSAFVEWTGCDSVAGSVCHISLSGASTVGAVFNQVQHSLTVSKAGSGTGSVSCNGGACAGSYPEGTTVTLAAAPDSSSTFSGWSGGGCSGTGSCTVTVNANTAVTATFDLKKSDVLPPAPCVAAVGSSATVTSGQAAVVLTCPAGTAGAKGKITLKAKVKQGKKQKTVAIGTASFDVAAGKSATVKVKITNGQVKKQLNNGKAVKAQVSGDSVKSSTVKLKPKQTGKKGGHK